MYLLACVWRGNVEFIPEHSIIGWLLFEIESPEKTIIMDWAPPPRETAPVGRSVAFALRPMRIYTAPVESRDNGRVSSIIESGTYGSGCDGVRGARNPTIQSLSLSFGNQAANDLRQLQQQRSS